MNWHNVTSSLGILRLLAIHEIINSRFQLKNARPIGNLRANVLGCHLLSLAWRIEFPRSSKRGSIIKNKYRKGRQSTEGGWARLRDSILSTREREREREREASGHGPGKSRSENCVHFGNSSSRNDAATKSKTPHSALFVRESPRVFFLLFSFFFFFHPRSGGTPDTPSRPCRPCPSFLCSLRSRGCERA